MTVAVRAWASTDDGRFVFVLAVAVVLAVLSAIALAWVGIPVPLVIVVTTAVLWVLFARPDSATLVFAFLLYANVPVVAVQFHGVPDIIAVLTPLVLGIPLVVYVIVRAEPVIFTPAMALMFAYLGVMLLSAAFSLDPQTGAESAVTFVTEGLLLVGLVANAIRSVRTLTSLLWVVLLSGALMGGLSMYQEVTHTYRDPYLGFAQTLYTPGSEEAATAVLSDTARPRLAGPIGSKNRYAQILVVLLPFSLLAYRLARRRWWRWVAIASGVMLLGGIALTFSRGAALAIVGLGVAMVVLRIIKLRRLLPIIALLVVVTIAVAPQYVTRLETLTTLVSDPQDVDNAVLGRATSNLASLLAFAEHPVLGVGPGSYAANFSREYANELGLRHFDTNRRAHNLYLEIGADLGVPGLLVFLAILGVTMLQLWRLRRAWETLSPRNSEIATALFLMLLGYAMTGMFLHLAYARYFWFLIAVANAAIWLLERDLRQLTSAGRVEVIDGATERAAVRRVSC
jgi:O-antigen ligase